MAQTNISIRMDEDLKKQFDAFCSDVGMNMTTAICIFAKTVVREKRIPFEIRSDIPNTETLQAIKDVQQGKNLHGPFNSVKELMENF